MATELEEIKNRIDLVELVSSYIQVKKSGRNYKALCPFHNEKAPSLMISPEKQIWHCFGCSEGGDHFGWVMKMEGIDFSQALRMLADRAGVKLERDALKRVSQESREKEKLYYLNQVTANFYHYLLTKHQIGKTALEYLKKRGIGDKSIKDFQLGYAPDKIHGLLSFFEKKDTPEDDLLKAGLVTKSEFAGKTRSKYIDKFRGRIMMPICDVAGNIVGFTGRLLVEKKDAPKYLNSPDTLVFNKSLVLYGLDKARKAIREKNRVIIVEGNTDVVTLHARGYLETVASSGTALTTKQFEILSHYTENIYLAFDSDEAGIIAAKRASEIALTSGIEVKFIIIPEAKDPDELIRKNPKLWEKVLASPKNLIEFSLYYYKKDPKDLSTSDKRKITSEILPILKKLDDAVLRAEYLEKLATMLGIDIKYLEEALIKVKSEKLIRSTSSGLMLSKAEALKVKNWEIKKPEEKKDELQEKEKQLDNRQILERKIIGLLVLFFGKLSKTQDELDVKEFTDKLSEQTLKGIKKYFAKYKKFDLKDFLKKLPEGFRKKLDFLVLSTEGEFANLEDEEIVREFLLLVNKFKSVRKEKVTRDFAQKIKKAEGEKDIRKVKSLLSDLQKKLEG